MLLAWPTWALAQAVDGASLEYAVKANYLYKFGPFVSWPASAFANAASPFNICVFGNDPFGRILDEATAGQNISGHPVVVRRLPTVSADSPCHVLYVGRSSSEPPAMVIRTLAGKPVLTVTDERQGVSGGMVHFVLRDGRVRFALDAHAAQSSGLVMSSKLLGLATSLHPGDGR